MTDIELIGSCTWVLSLVIGLSILASFWKDEISRLAGFYAIKPFVVELICKSWLIPLIHDLGIIMPYRSKVLGFYALSSIANAVSYSVVEIVFVIFLAYYFRNLYRRKANIFWSFIFLDCFRWIFVNLASLAIFTDFQFGHNVYQIYAYDFVWYFVYSVLALNLGVIRSKRIQRNELAK